MDLKSLFSVKKACKDCPFRKDNANMLAPGRLEGIIETLHDNKPFHCHKTIDYTKARKEKQLEHAKYCAGSLVYLEKAQNTNVPMRLGLMIGVYDPLELSGFDEVIEPLGLDKYVRSPEDLTRLRKDAKTLYN